MKIGTCLVCFTQNVNVFDITGSQLRHTYEKITDFKVHNALHNVCRICHTRLIQFNLLFKQIRDTQYIEEQSNEVECEPLLQLSYHVIERGSIPYHVDLIQDFEKVKKEAPDLIEKTESSKLNKVEDAEQTTKLPQFICDICKRIFKRKGNLKDHLKTHYKKPKDKTLHNPKRLIRRATNKSFACNICDKTYSRSDHLKLHKLCHTKDTPFSCDVCKKQFKRKSNLKDHLKTHTNDKPHKCDICSKTFLKGSNLKAHKLIHTREKPFSCNVCNRTFNRKSHLTVHQRTHTGNKPYQCQTCKQLFSRSDHLRMHQKIHNHNKDIFVCDVCQEVFTYKQHIKMHMQKTHL